MTTPLALQSNGGGVLRTLLLFKMFEVLVVMMVMSTLYYVLIDRVMFNHAQYEEAEVKWTIAMLNSAKRTNAAMRMAYTALGRKDVLAKIPDDSANPMLLLQPRLHNYRGEMCNADLEELPLGNWYVDTCRGWLVYVYKGEKIFSYGHRKILKFNVESLHLLTEPS